MPAPVYNDGSHYGHRNGGYRHRRGWGQTPEPARLGWLDQVGSWLVGTVPTYAGQGQPTAVGSGSPVYLPAPPPTGSSDAATLTPQPSAAVIMVPHT